MSRKGIADVVRAEYEACTDLRAMAARLGVSYAYLKSCASRLGIKNRRTASDAIRRVGDVKPYIPRHGSTVYKVVKHLRTLPQGTEIDSNALAEMLGIERRQVMMHLGNAAAAGMLKCRKESETYKAPTIWSLGVVPERQVKEPKPKPKREAKPKGPKKPKVIPVGKEWQKQARTTWANAAARRMGADNAQQRIANTPAVIPDGVTVQKLPGFTEDMRFKVDPKHVGPFTRAGIGRDVETGRAW